MSAATFWTVSSGAQVAMDSIVGSAGRNVATAEFLDGLEEDIFVGHLKILHRRGNQRIPGYENDRENTDCINLALIGCGCKGI